MRYSDEMLDEKNRIYQEYENDIAYIDKEIITKQPNGNYCKYSRILRAVSVYNMPANFYIGYWKNQYKNRPAELRKGILEACEKKLTEGLTDKEEMVKLIEESKDFEIEKFKVLSALGSCYI